VSVTVLYTFYFAYSMLSEIDELCMPAYINVRRFHWILLIIQIDKGRVFIMDSRDKALTEWGDMQEMLQR